MKTTGVGGAGERMKRRKWNLECYCRGLGNILVVLTMDRVGAKTVN